MAHIPHIRYSTRDQKFEYPHLEGESQMPSDMLFNGLLEEMSSEKLGAPGSSQICTANRIIQSRCIAQ